MIAVICPRSLNGRTSAGRSANRARGYCPKVTLRSRQPDRGGGPEDADKEQQRVAHVVRAVGAARRPGHLGDFAHRREGWLRDRDVRDVAPLWPHDHQENARADEQRADRQPPGERLIEQHDARDHGQPDVEGHGHREGALHAQSRQGRDVQCVAQPVADHAACDDAEEAKRGSISEVRDLPGKRQEDEKDETPGGEPQGAQHGRCGACREGGEGHAGGRPDHRCYQCRKFTHAGPSYARPASYAC